MNQYAPWLLKTMIICMFIITFYIIFTSYIIENETSRPKPVAKQYSDHFAISTDTCKIPNLDPFSDEVKQFVEKPSPIICNHTEPLVYTNLSTIYINVDALPQYNITNDDNFTCFFQPFWRKDPTSGPDDSVRYGNRTFFTSPIKIYEEFVKVTCLNKSTIIYQDYFSFVPIKQKTNLKTYENLTNVVVVGIDSISRVNLYRQMPKTLRYIKELGAVEMLGYNKVGDNTFPNLIPILTGYSEEELQKICWKDDRQYFDGCKYIWDNYKNKGYFTGFAEDSSNMGVFNYIKVGFQKQPTDYYWRTFDYEAEKNIGYNKPLNSKLCLGGRLIYKVLLDYAIEFVRSLKEQKHFGFFWGTSLSHDYLNLPALSDGDYVKFFEALRHNDAFDKTVIIFLSDHGIRWGGIRSTQQGYLEERLPFLFLVLPEWFRKKYYIASQNLKDNAHLLTTPFDLHETFLDLLNPDKLQSLNQVQSPDRPDYSTTRGISLFGKISENRTCKSAGIASHFCTCMDSTILSTEDIVVQNATLFILSSINDKFENYTNCAKLNVTRILRAKVTQHENVEDKTIFSYYTVAFETLPGQAQYESTVLSLRENKFRIMGTISRLNLYGNSSACIDNFHLKLYCNCIK